MRVPWRGKLSSDRRRSWLILVLAAGLVFSYLIVWTTYSAAHTYPRYRQLAPGVGATSMSNPERYRVLGMTETTTLMSSDGDSARAGSHEVWVIASVEVTIDRREQYVGCDLRLLGPGGRLWESPLDPPQRKAPTFCDGADVKPGVPYAYEQLFQIPDRYADQLLGLVLVNDLSGAPSVVIAPA